MLSDRRHRLLILTGELLLFAVLSLRWMPHPAQWTTAISQGYESVGTVPLFNAWTIAWNIDRARHGWRGYWAAPFFHPAPNPFSLCEAQPQTAVLAPLESWQGLAFAYNVYLAAMLTLNGWVACRWLETIGLHGPARLFGGLLVQTLPFVHWQFGVLQLVPVWGILWTWTAVWRYCAQPAWRPALSAGLAFGCTYWLCNYYGLFLSVLLPIMAPVLLLFRRFGWSLIPHSLSAGLIAGAMIAPVARMQLQADKQHDLTRLPETLRQLSLQPRDVTRCPTQRIPAIALAQFNPDAARLRWSMGLGTLTYLAAAAGGLIGLCRENQRRITLLMGSVGVAAFLLATGPDGIGGIRPFAYLMDWYPGLAKVRSPFRFVVFLQLALSTWAAFTVDGVWPSEAQAATPRYRRLRMIVAAVIAVAMLYETWPDRSPVCRLPDLDRNSGWCRWLTQHTEPGSPLACLPFSPGTQVADHLGDVEWMLLGLRHHNRLCNGYAAYFPTTYRQLRAPLKQFPRRESLSALSALAVRTVVVRREQWLGREADRDAAVARGDITLRFADDAAGVDVWSISPPAVATHGAGLEPTPAAPASP